MSRSGENQKVEVIVIDDDSDAEDGVVVPSEAAAVNAAMDPDVSTLMTVMNLSNQQKAKSLLSRFQNDLQRTISYLLENKSSPSPSAEVRAVDSARMPTKRSLFSPPRRGGALACKKKPRTTSIGSPDDSIYKAVDDGAAKEDDTARNPRLSEQWKACYQNAASVRQADSASLFVDPDFPPLRSSLDGRQTARLQQKGSSSSSSSSVPKCHCGLPASAKVVQRDGPNYGKFFLSCGQDRQGVRKRRARVVVMPQPTSPKVVVVNPYAKKNKASPSPSPSASPPQRFKCDFFQWDKDGSQGAHALLGYSSRYSTLLWQHFGIENKCTLYRKEPAPDQVRQGAVGNCWFLSALSVVAEKTYLIRRIVPHTELNCVGCYQINLCLDGQWQEVLVDSNLPVVVEDLSETSKNNNKRRRGGISKSPPGKQTQQVLLRGGVPLTAGHSKKPQSPRKMTPTTLCWSQNDDTLMAFPAFCAAPNLQLWPALVEKAYAKAHGCYAMLSGGFIAEGLQDLTGAPTETIIFARAEQQFQKDTLWESLRVFAREGFLMGVATAGGGDGLVGGHAYSVLDIYQVDDSVVGEQSKMTDFFKKSNGKHDTNEMQRKLSGRERTTVRLVRIRNPWGKREWKGDFSADSEQWTKALRHKLGSSDTFAKGDGTFFMAFDDMLERFHHMDIAKTREGWKHSASDGVFEDGRGPMTSSRHVYHLKPSAPTLAFITVIQPKKRANTRSKYWYCDPCLIILKRSAAEGEWACEACVLTGIRRQTTVEIFIDPKYTYCCIPFSCLASTRRNKAFSFRLTSYSLEEILIERQGGSDEIRDASVRLLQKEILSRERKMLLPVAERGLLACIHGECSLVLMAVNGSHDSFLSLKLTVDLQDGTIVLLGCPDASHDIPPRSQRVLAVVANDGRLSTTTKVSFRYMSSTVPVRIKTSGCMRNGLELDKNVEVSMSGEFLTSHIPPSDVQERGCESIDTYKWIPQLGASATT